MSLRLREFLATFAKAFNTKLAKNIREDREGGREVKIAKLGSKIDTGRQ